MEDWEQTTQLPLFPVDEKHEDTVKWSLHDYQVEKLEYWFRFLCPNEKNCLDRASLERFMTKVLDFTGWGDVIEAQVREVHETFFEALLEKQQEIADDHKQVVTDYVTKDAWLTIWSRLLGGAMALSYLPVWARLVPDCIYKMINRRNQEGIQAVDLEHFYRDMVKIDPEEARTIATDAFNCMTDFGYYVLNLDLFEMIFANFLLGKTEYGPGRYIFGLAKHLEVQKFTLIQPMPDVKDEKVKVKPVQAGRRPSNRF